MEFACCCPYLVLAFLQARACLRYRFAWHCRHGYLQSLPRREYVPIFWTDAELALLTGTELDGKATEDRSDLCPAEVAHSRLHHVSTAYRMCIPASS